MYELLAPAGDMEKLKTAVYFGADAVYFGGKDFGLRAQAQNFCNEEISDALKYVHTIGKKGYVTVNIFPKDNDFSRITEFLKFLQSAGADGVIVSDAGIIKCCRQHAPKLNIHLSTQANTLNSYSAKFWRDAGVKRIVLARELDIRQIEQICNELDGSAQTEVFVHGAMCISYSGRCLLSNYLTARDSNRGQCVQACRWEYEIREKSRKGGYMTLQEDGRGSYILNSKDLNLIRHLKQLINAGVNSFKIEGRMKSEYYVGTVINSYKRALCDIQDNKPFDENLYNELFKTSHRQFTTGFLFNDECGNVNSDSSIAVSGYEFCANVLGYDADKGIKVMQRNRFYKGDELEVLSPSDNHNSIIKVEYMTDSEGNEIQDAKIVQQTLYIKSNVRLQKYDMLRKKKVGNKE